MMGNIENMTIPKMENCNHSLFILNAGLLLVGINAKTNDPINKEKHRYKSVSDI